MTIDRPLADRVALVTGASRGLGRAIALALSGAGAHVIACARRRAALEDLDDEIHDRGGSATLVQFDLGDGAKIDALGPSLYERYKKLDVFVANAAILGTLAPLHHLEVEEVERVMTTNLTANWRLLRTLDPLLRASDAGRVICVSCEQATAADAYWSAYAASKAGLEALCQSYADETRNTSIRVNTIAPGAINTELRTKAYPGENPSLRMQPGDVAPLALKLAAPAFTSTGGRYTKLSDVPDA